jgi:lipid II:glycine glycyltransferase (peptidoglycan interpeptide bridge formation enzyme)
MDWTNESLRKRVLDDLQSFAKKQGAIFLKLDPMWCWGAESLPAWMKSQKTADRP